MSSDRSFGDWLRQRRRVLDLTQDELAQQVGCSAITLRKLEAESRRPSKQIAERLAEVLQVPPVELAAFLRFARGDPFAASGAITDGSPIPAGNSIPASSASATGRSTAAGSSTAAEPDNHVLPVQSITAPPWPAEPSAGQPRAPEADEGPAPGESPFQGLRYFDEPEADLFFGREALVDRLVARLAALGEARQTASRRVLAVVGASGSGKSSVVRAGVVPALRRARGTGSRFEPIHILTPTAHPLEALAGSLTRAVESVTATATLVDDLARDTRSLRLYAQRLLSAADGHGDQPQLLLVIDQFEELFTLCRSETERQAFIDGLMEAGERVTVLLTLRADFYSHCAPYAVLREALAEQQEYIGPMTPAELRQAIEQPARLRGWTFEAGVVDQILRDVGASEGQQAEPGALPLLSHALLATWQHRRGRRLTLRSYAEAGRVQGAIATTAEAVFQSMPPDEQVIARNIFVRLTELGEGTQDTRRRVALTELLPGATTADGQSAVAAVLKTLSDARLVTEDRDTVEVAHEALIREWPTLRQWLAEDRDGLRLHRHVTEAAQEWDELNRDPSELYRGPRLAEAIEWAEWAPHAADLNTLEREFLQASRAWAEQEAAEREAQQQRELAAARRLAQTERAQAETERRATVRLHTRNRVITAVGVTAAIAAVLAAVFASRNAGLAASNAAEASAAQAAARTASARGIALSAINNLGVDPQRSLLLALQSVNLTYSVDKTVLPEAAGALHAAVSASHLQRDLADNLLAGAMVGVDFSPDGKRLATINQDGAANVWDVTPGGPGGTVLRMPGTAGTGLGWEAVAFSPDGKRLATANEDVAVTLLDAQTGKQLLSLSYPDGVQSIAFSPDGKRIAAGGNGNAVDVWDAATGQLLLTLCCADTTRGLAFSPDGLHIVTGNDDKLVRVWDAATGRLLQTLVGHANAVSGVAFNSAGTRLASVSYDGTVRVWDAASWQQTLVIETESPYSLAFSPDGKRLATGGQDGVVKIWDAVTGQLLFTRLGHTKMLLDVAFSPDGTRLATASADGTVKIWDAGPAREVVTLFADTGAVFTVAFSPDGSRIVTGGLDRQVRLWQAASGQALPGPADEQDVIRSAVFSPDGLRLATASEYSPPKVWDAASGQLLLTLSGHTLGDWSIAFSPDGSRLATASLSGSTTIWDANTGEEITTLPDTGGQDVTGIFMRFPSLPGSPFQRVARLAFSPDGKQIVTSSFGLDAYVWDAATGQQLLQLLGHSDSIQALAYSPDGKRIATASLDGTAIVHEAATGSKIYSLSGHTTGVTSVAFSPDGKWLATGSLDGTAKLWQAATGQLAQDLPGPAQGVTSLAFSPDSTRLALAGLDGTTRIYQLGIDDLITLAKTRVTRFLTSAECDQYLHGPCPAN